jgi:two-component system phosphate regulon response regulator PhoB
MPKTILIVEDFEDSRILLKYLLERLGYKVLEAEDGFKGVEIAKRQIPDLIFMDMALPLINGLSATKIIRQFKETSKIPIIAITASGQFIYPQAIEAGCNDMILKPLDIDKLQPMIEQYLPVEVNS